MLGVNLEGALKIRVEYQDWILTAACVAGTVLCCLPCFFAGNRAPYAVAFTRWVRSRRHAFFCLSGALNFVGIGSVIYLCPDWNVNDFLLELGRFLVWVLRHTEKFCMSGLILFVFYVLYAHRQKIYAAMGVEHVRLLRWDLKDALLCARPRTLELFVFKADELPSADVLKPNDVFLQVHFAYNEGVKTRVHNNVGANCMFRESMQLNFDDNDEESKLNILVCNQEALMSTTIAQRVFSNEETRQLLRSSAGSDAFDWSESYFEEVHLTPAGKVWLRLAEIDPGRNANDDSEMALLGAC